MKPRWQSDFQVELPLNTAIFPLSVTLLAKKFPVGKLVSVRTYVEFSPEFVKNLSHNDYGE